jgi:protocatechuate 3,4-dioxygenase beta subunit
MSGDETGNRGIRRREMLAGAIAGTAGLGFLWSATRHGVVDPGSAAAVAEAAGASCTLSRELTEGPYWIDTELTRRDITEDRPGVPLRIVFTVQDASTCRVIPSADVEIWHADAGGEYSGFDGTSSSRYLRGHQKADAKGRAVFDTIYPGWYRGRTPHIHLKVHVGGDAVHTGQLFFRDALSAAVYRTRHYRARGEAETTNAQDGIYVAGSRLAVRRRRGNGYIGRMTLNVEA